ncbi:MAG: response regulator transcription factor [Dehalococcoidia bacterium]
MRVAVLDSRGVAQSLVLSLRMRWPDLEVIRLDGNDGLANDVSGLAPNLVLVETSFSPTHTLELIQEVRAACKHTLVLALAQEPCEAEEVALLEAGADACVPVGLGEVLFVARVSAALRRAGAEDDCEEATLRCGNLLLKPDSYEACVGGRLIAMTPTEFRLLCHLGGSVGKVVTQEALERAIWGARDVFSRDCLRKYVARLRQKLESARASVEIVTVSRIGYKLVE